MMRFPIDARWFGSVLILTMSGVLTMSGCSFMGARTEAKTFLLDPGPAPAAHTMTGKASISFVDVPGLHGYGNFQYRHSASDWETDPYNRFLSSPQQMMTGVMRNWFIDSRQFSSVLLPNEGAASDLRVDTEVSELYIDFRNPDAPEAVIVMEVVIHRLKDSGVGDQVFKKLFTARAPVTERTPEAFVAAWNAALRETLLSLTMALR